MDTNPRSLLDRLLGAAVTLCIVAVLLTVTVHLVESVATALLVGGGVIAATWVVVWLVRRQQNRYW